MRSLRRSGSLLGKALGLDTGVGWHSVAGFQKFCGSNTWQITSEDSAYCDLIPRWEDAGIQLVRSQLYRVRHLHPSSRGWPNEAAHRSRGQCTLVAGWQNDRVY
jgi:hypothetical protein